MLKLESRIGVVPFSDETVFNYLSDFRNFSALIPGDKIKNWEATADTCRFSADMIGEVGFKIIEKEPFKLIKVTGDEHTKYSFFLWIQLKKEGEKDTRIKLTLHAEINPMLQMMAKKPLQNILDMLVDQIEKIRFENDG